MAVVAGSGNDPGGGGHAAVRPATQLKFCHVCHFNRKWQTCQLAALSVSGILGR
jgi:hypothetical protein